MCSSVKWLSRPWTWTTLSLPHPPSPPPLLPFGERVEKHRDHQWACVLTMHLPYLIGAKQTWLGPIWWTISALCRRDTSPSLSNPPCCCRCSTLPLNFCSGRNFNLLFFPCFVCFVFFGIMQHLLLIKLKDKNGVVMSQQFTSTGYTATQTGTVVPKADTGKLRDLSWRNVKIIDSWHMKLYVQLDVNAANANAARHRLNLMCIRSDRRVQSCQLFAVV